jgi:hypothetical protein
MLPKTPVNVILEEQRNDDYPEQNRAMILGHPKSVGSGKG